MYYNQPNPVYVFVPCYIPYQIPPVPKFDSTKEEQHSDSEKEQTKIIEEEVHTNASGIVRGKGQLWTEEEVNNLVQYYKKYHGNWKFVIKHLKGRNISQCSQKYRKLMDQEKRTKKKWTVDEDKILLESYAEFGRQWIKISQKLPGRTSKQVRDRYVNQINPTINHDHWTDEEDEIILEEFKQGGARWAIISKKLNNRSENQVKNRFYYTILKKYKGEQHPYLKVQE
ncbi:unnamed protein product (macronuclear) [Paramecium tetraurelia]|uniref:Myb-like DNA-binding domain containing protein n=1 Tax=Paramecium tetraurelia TaxID=5888 RepID=A0CMG3_PARTE|nr:uncharacterized protein GSPATT00008459001 [Paramecium tetraurelia]CAK71980.1 unnamed protein product [Paramecium tetraurelia]|eukprot:XP_001439377.1 hypothetical protein (macronuclear) [Paramecium tetraurelia strain d4-2]